MPTTPNGDLAALAAKVLAAAGKATHYIDRGYFEADEDDDPYDDPGVVSLHPRDATALAKGLLEALVVVKAAREVSDIWQSTTSAVEIIPKILSGMDALAVALKALHPPRSRRPATNIAFTSTSRTI